MLVFPLFLPFQDFRHSLQEGSLLIGRLWIIFDTVFCFVCYARVSLVPVQIYSLWFYRVDIKGFKTFIDTLTKQMGQPFSLVSELLILCGLEMQTLPESGSALVKEIQVSPSPLSLYWYTPFKHHQKRFAYPNVTISPKGSLKDRQDMYFSVLHARRNG